MNKTSEQQVEPTTDLSTGTIHLCSFEDGSRIFVRGDLLMIWRAGATVSMTPSQWIDVAEKGVPLCGG